MIKPQGTACPYGTSLHIGVWRIWSGLKRLRRVWFILLFVIIDYTLAVQMFATHAVRPWFRYHYYLFPNILLKVPLNCDDLFFWIVLQTFSYKHENRFLALPLLTKGAKLTKTRCQIWCTIACTEIRFQKCSQSGKNGSKHPLLSISMACNVI